MLRARLQAAVEAHGHAGEPNQAKKPSAVPYGVFPSVGYILDVSERIARGFPAQSAAWRSQADAYLKAIERGEDPYKKERGRIVSRGYVSPISTRIQGYTVYVPPNYSEEKTYPLMVMLHGGSSNGNLFLGVVLGNNMNWKEYDFHLWDSYEPRWSPDWIVVAPDGYGQILWRYMGEQDVLDVIDDVALHYRVDPDRIALGGLSNGGVGAYAIGSRHASRFSVVQAIAGAPSWLQYSGETQVKEIEAKLMRPWSAMDLYENWVNTDFRYYHGDRDPGPMRPAYVHALDATLARSDVPHRGKWFEAGHDLLYLVHRHGKVYQELEPVRRKRSPGDVRVVTGDYRAPRQHWLEVTRIARYPELATLKASAQQGVLTVTTANVAAFAIDLRDVPETGASLKVEVDGREVFSGQRSELGHRVHLVRTEPTEPWRLGFPDDSGLRKRPKLSGPMSDAYYDRMVHVYGTGRPENAKMLRELSQKGARGWPLWPWSIEQEVIADTEVTQAIRDSAHLVLYGTPGDNRELDSIMESLPIRVEGDAVVAGDQRFTGKGLGTRFIYPNPKAQARYVIVLSGPTVDGVRRGHNLPDFVPDYVIYDASSTTERPRLVPKKLPLARGFFDARWQLTAP